MIPAPNPIPRPKPVHAVVAQDVLLGREPDILNDIHAPGVAAAVWQRAPAEDFQKWIDALPFAQLPALRTVVPVHLAEAAVQAACQKAGTPPGPEQDMLASDAGALALMMANIMDVRQVRLRLDVASGTMCPKFHIDQVPARLLCTYRGKGTEYVPVTSETRAERIRQVRTGAVGLFRGGAWPGPEETGLLHRSPAVSSLGEARLLLVIDAVS